MKTILPELEAAVNSGAVPLIIIDGVYSEIDNVINLMSIQKWAAPYTIIKYSLGNGIKQLTKTSKLTAPENEFKGNPTGVIDWFISNKVDNANTIIIFCDYGNMVNDAIFNSILLHFISEFALKNGYTIILTGNGIRQSIPSDIFAQCIFLTCPLPTDDEIKQSITNLYTAASLVPPDKNTIEHLTREAAGMTLTQLTNNAAISLYNTSSITPEALRNGIRQIIKEIPGMELLQNLPTLNNIGGYEYAKKSMLSLIKAYEKPKANPKGVILTGPPGTGKSLLGKALAGSVGWKCVIVSLAQFKDKYVGESQKNMMRCLQLLEAFAPVIVILDEIEATFGSPTGQKESDTSGEMLSLLLTWQAERVGKKIFTIATCNRLNVIPPEATRDGRFNKRIFVDLPNKSAKEVIWQLYLRKFGYITNDDLIKYNLPDDTGWSGAEIEACVETAYIEDIDFITAAKQIIPVSRRMGDEMMRELRVFAAKSCVDAETGLPVLPEPVNNTVNTTNIANTSTNIKTKLKTKDKLDNNENNNHDGYNIPFSHN